MRLNLGFKLQLDHHLGDTITVKVEAIKVREDKPIVTLTTVCTNQDGNNVIEGEAVVLVQ